MARTQQQIETLEAQVAELRERLAALEAHVAGEVEAPARSIRRARARRASRRRAVARALRPDPKARIVEYLAKHPGSTAGEVAKGLDQNRSTVSSQLAQLTKLGRVRKADRGYAVKP
jgi:DNA-binding transcriptional ArsR family regulator